MTIGERVLELIRIKGMTQKEFSEKTGIAESTISDWKRKKLNPSSDKILIICNTLGVDVYSLLSSAESANVRGVDYIHVKRDTEEAVIIETYRALDDKGRMRFLGYTEALKKD